MDVNLVIVGKQGWMMESLVDRLHQNPELGKRLFWLDGISDEYLEKIYAASTCLIAASAGEGFGLQLIEGIQIKNPLLRGISPYSARSRVNMHFILAGLPPLPWRGRLVNGWH